MGKIWIGMCLSSDSFLEPFDRPGHRFYVDDKSDGFGKLLSDMIEWDLGPLFAMGSA